MAEPPEEEEIPLEVLIEMARELFEEDPETLLEMVKRGIMFDWAIYREVYEPR